MSRRTSVKPTPPRHPFWADADIPPDHRGNRRCRRCGVLGQPGDSRHTDEYPATPPGDRSSQIIGERESEPESTKE